MPRLADRAFSAAARWHQESSVKWFLENPTAPTIFAAPTGFDALGGTHGETVAVLAVVCPDIRARRGHSPTRAITWRAARAYADNRACAAARGCAARWPTRLRLRDRHLEDAPQAAAASVDRLHYMGRVRRHLGGAQRLEWTCQSARARGRRSGGAHRSLVAAPLQPRVAPVESQLLQRQRRHTRRSHHRWLQQRAGRVLRPGNHRRPC